jgi:2,3-bisphosphoglycerate-dependent phosphoglycerate mutase
MSITLVRHAESHANVGNLNDVDWLTRLTPKGQLQAQYLAGFLPYRTLPITSPFYRAQETAIAAGYPICEIWRVEEFTYLSQCRRPAERELLSNAYWERSDPDYRDGPDAESFKMFIERVIGVLELLQDKSAIVFTHSGFIKAVYWIICGGGLRMDEFRKFKHTIALPNTAMVELRYTSYWRIYNPIVSHLPENERS